MLQIVTTTYITISTIACTTITCIAIFIIDNILIILLLLLRNSLQAPEFFYSMLEKQEFRKLLELSKFTTALEDLVES